MKKSLFMLCMIVVMGSPLVFSDDEANNLRNPDWDNRLPEGKLGKVTKDWLRTQRRKLGVGPNVPLKFETLSSYRNGEGRITFRFKAYVRGIPVVAKHIVVHINEATRDVLGMRGRLNLEGLADIRPRINRGDAGARVAQQGLALTDIVGDAELVFLTRADDTSVLSWQVEVKYGVGLAAEHDFIFFDAMTGDLEGRHAQVHRSRNRLTFDANNQDPLNAQFMRGEVSTDMGIPCLDDVHNNARTVYDYFDSEKSRDSYDDGGATIQSVIRVLIGGGSNNAMWNGAYLAYGEGDGTDYSCWSSLDLVAHEYMHAVTQHTAALVYQGESGALNESYSDVFAAVIEANDNGGVDQNTWKLFEEFKTPNVSGDAERYMNDPTEDNISRAYYPNRYQGSADSGGVHLNSGIPNLAFYLLSEGGNHPDINNNINVGGIGITKAANIWYDALMTYVEPNETMHEARGSTLVSAFDLYTHDDMSQVANAWAAVGVGYPRDSSDYACQADNFSGYQSTISDIYIAYYGRPADSSGMDYWNTQLTNNNGDLTAIMSGFGNSAEFNARFGGLNTTQLVTNIYQQLFNRDPDSGGLTYYVNSINAGTRTLESIALDILNGALGTDLVVLNNRRDVAGDHYRHIESTGVSLSAYQLAKLLLPITDDHDTAESACADSLLLSESAD